MATKNSKKATKKRGQKRTNFYKFSTKKNSSFSPQNHLEIRSKKRANHSPKTGQIRHPQKATKPILLKIESKILGHFVLFFYICNTVLL